MKKIIYIALILILATSCSSFLDVNENPNNPTNVPVDQLLPNAMVKSNNMEILGLSNGPHVLTSNSLSVHNSLNQLGCVWAGYWSKASDAPNTSSFFILEETYAVDKMAIDWGGYSFWEDIYKILTNYKDIENKATKDGDLAYVGIAKIMQAWHFMRLVDLYNNIPFEEALQGTVNPTPKFESGEYVYSKCIDMITSGINDIKTADQYSKKPTSDDIMFNGNEALWAKFGNTLKLRALLRQSQLSKDTYIATEISKIVSEGSGFLSVGETAYINPGYVSGTTYKASPLWEKFYRSAQGSLTTHYNTLRPTEFVIEKYESLNDPRLAQIYVPVNGEYIGVPLGSVANEHSMSKTSPFKGPKENNGVAAGLFKSETQSSVFLGSFESLFLQAEAAQRGWINGNAVDYYSQAISESFKYIGVANANDYIAQPTVSFAAATDKIERIIEQKWLALNTLNGFEAWCDYRRLGIPTLPQSLQSPKADENYRPLRLSYRVSEISQNGAQVEAQGKIDPFVSTVFWNK